MEEFNLITPTLLFSAISLIMLAYTNRFLQYAQLVRNLSEKYQSVSPENRHLTKAQIDNLKKRLVLTRNMQFFGVGSLLLCTVTMLLVFIDLRTAAVVMFFIALVAFTVSLALSVLEIMLSTRALDIHLKGIDNKME